MASVQYLNNAVLCVKNLQKKKIRDELLFQDPQNASLAATLSTMSHCASYVQDTVNKNPNLENIELVVACRVKKSNSRSSGIRQKNFFLWKTKKPITSTERTGSVVTEEGDAPVALTIQHHHDLNEERNQNPIPSSEHTEDENRGDDVTPASVVGGTIPDDRPQDSKYSVPVHVAANCLQLLLDGSGFSTHKSCIQRSAYSELGIKPLIEVIQQVFEAEKHGRSRSDLARNQGDEGKPATTPNNRALLSQHAMIYRDLLPDHLRHENPSQGIDILVPDVRIEYNGEPKVSKMMDVTLKIRKPDRNKKDQNFALICAVMHFTGEEGICAKVLRKYAKEGLAEKGCVRRMKFCAASSSQCGGFDRCKYAKRSICSFYTDMNEPPVGRGKVDPECRILDGKSVPEGFVAIRFSMVTDEIVEASTRAAVPTTFHEEPATWLKQPVIWKKTLIDRVKILGEYEVIGSAILVEDHIPGRIHESITRRISSSGRRAKGGVDVSNAVIVCDLQLEGNMVQNEITYPFAEWYNVPCLRVLKSMHFQNGKPPFHLNTEALSNIVALLWHKDRYQEITGDDIHS